jgi:hypothetical protein
LFGHIHPFRTPPWHKIYSLQSEAKIRIMEDKQHDIILGELKKYRIAHLRNLYGTINAANDPAKELLKFQWLKSNGVITEHEFNKAQLQIRNIQADVAVPQVSVQ